jgi:hypothetical protein
MRAWTSAWLAVFLASAASLGHGGSTTSPTTSTIADLTVTSGASPVTGVHTHDFTAQGKK